MFLRRIHLENVRCIKNTKLSFLGENNQVRKWTLLLGQNGCGKSTILRSAALALAGSQAIPLILGETNSWIRSGCQKCTVTAEIESRHGDISISQVILKKDDQIDDVLSSNAEGLRVLDAALRESSPNYFLAGYGVSRHLGQRGESRLSSQRRSTKLPRADALMTLFHSDGQLNSLQDWATELHYRRGKAGLSIVREALRNLMWNLEFVAIDRNRGDLLFRTPEGVLPLSQISDGYQNVAAWCGDLLYRIMQANLAVPKPLETRGLLLIDEIDLHLHPIWQRQLQRFLTDRLPHFQILATTHSLLTAQQVDREELYLLERSGKSGHPDVVPFCGSPRELMVHQLVGPFFGLKTTDSLYVENLKAEYRQLRDKKRRTKTDTTRLKELEAIIRDLPDWNRSVVWKTQHSRMLMEVLSSIRAIRVPVEDSNTTNRTTAARAVSTQGRSRRGRKVSKPAKSRRDRGRR